MTYRIVISDNFNTFELVSKSRLNILTFFLKYANGFQSYLLEVGNGYKVLSSYFDYKIISTVLQVS